MFASVLQCGFLSEPIKIGRGCRQGDPIAPYLFIICSLFLSELVDQNNKIKGITLRGGEIKIVQFADNATLFLDGTESSLQEALNIIEIFGSYSGLKMNKEKSELIWIGNMKNSSKELSKNTPMSWGSTDFKLLGITFSTNIESIPQKNYSPLLQNVEQTINAWNKRKLSPLGKITVIKTLIVSKFIHMFQTLPAPQMRH